MIALSAIGVDVNIFLLLFIGLAVGIIGGFIGVGGGYMVTPSLVVLGFPGYAAVGVDITHITGKSIVAAVRHRQLGNIDVKLAVVMILGTMAGVEVGVRLLNFCKLYGICSEAVLICSIIITTFIGIFTYWETRQAKRKLDEIKASGKELPRDVYLTVIAKKIQSIRIPPMMYFSKSRVHMSLWVILVVGFFTGMLAGFFGVGGGFIRMPALIYLIGVPSIIAVGTDLFEIIISGGYGTIRHTMSGNVVIEAAVIMILGACIGAQIGALVTQYVRGLSVRYILAYSVFFSAAGSMFKLIYLLTGETVAWYQTAAMILIFGGISLLMLMIIGLFGLGIMYQRGHHVPASLEPFLVKSD